MSFWHKLPRPFSILAPMEDVTDTVFRQIIAHCTRPDVFFTEFTNVEGMFSRGQETVRQRLRFSENERPLVAQIWGTDPDSFYKAAKYIASLGFDGIDLNFGCPKKKVVKKGACIALIENRKLAQEIIRATKEGAGELPISIKTRIGLNKIITEDWITFLLEQQLDAITIHGRTAKEKSEGRVHWNEINKTVLIRNSMKIDTLIVGNGDVMSWKEAREKCERFGLDGIMMGRGVFANPWIFDKVYPQLAHPKEERIKLLVKHAQLFDKTWGDSKPFSVMRKYFKIYVQGFPVASELRAKLMQMRSLNDTVDYINNKFIPPS